MVSTLLHMFVIQKLTQCYKSEIGIMTNRKNDQLLANKPISHNKNYWWKHRKTMTYIVLVITYLSFYK